MFLNWVYRKLGLGGFADIDERGEPDDSLPGQARWEWMEGTSEEIGVMEQIFNAHPEWN